MERNSNWAKELEDHRTIEYIPDRMRRLESKFWIVTAIGALAIIFGFMSLASVPGQRPELRILGHMGILGGGARDPDHSDTRHRFQGNAVASLGLQKPS